MEALILGRAISHQDLIINIGGVPITSISDITVNRKKQKEFGYGTSKYPVTYGSGRKEPLEVTFNMSKVESEALNDASPEGDVLELEPFDIPITEIGSVPRLLIIKNVLVQEVNQSSDIDTKDIRHVYTCIASHVKRS